MALTYPASILNSDGTKIISGGELQYPTGGATPQHLRYFNFTYQTSGLASGVTLMTPNVGLVIYDVGIAITTAFNGTTPKLDVGTFNGGTDGLFKNLSSAAVDGTKVYADATHNAGLGVPNAPLWLQDAVGSHGAAGTAAYNSTKILVSAANPILLIASQDGTKGGTAIDSTAGAGTVYFLVGTPLSL